MEKRWVLSGLTGVIVLLVLAVLVAQTATPVSARQILDRAYEVQTQQSTEQGIQHIRSEVFSNIEALPEKQGVDTTVESYLEPQSGKVRLVVTDNKTDRVLEAYAYDGSNAYSSDGTKGGQQSDGPLTIYRSPQNQPGPVSQKLSGDETLDSKTMFNKMRNDPHVQFVGQETNEDGRATYVLRSQQPIKIVVNNQAQNPMGFVTMYFEVDTYKLLGSRVTMEKDGQELLIIAQRILVDETLPEGNGVVWDLSDLQGVNIVNDTSGKHNLPEMISVEELAAKTRSAYLLETIPEGFSLEISGLSKQPTDGTFFYSATYTKGTDYFMVRAWTMKPIEDTSWAEEVYTTNSGLVLYFVTEAGISSSGGPITSAIVNTPEGISLGVTSTLPRETIKALAEELIPVSK